MKTKLATPFALLLTVVGLPAFGKGTAFTYQGRLNDGANPANGNYDLTFTLYDAASAGAQQGTALTNSPTAVSNGLFTVALDFGNQFPGAARWLEIAVRTNGSGNFFTLSPRQPLTAAPYAITAGNVVSNGLASGTYGNAVTFNNAANSFSGDGSALTGVNALTLGGLSSSHFWNTTGNAGTTAGTHFVGTIDNRPLELKVNGQRALRIEPTAYVDTVNVIGGSSLNSVGAGVVGATIGGGGSANYSVSPLTNRVEADFGTVSGGAANAIGSNAFYATIGGGNDNRIQTLAVGATISGGNINLIQPNAFDATVSGGSDNTIENNADEATISGGHANTIQTNATYAAVGGGDQNRIQINGVYATIPGGQLNSATNYAFAAGRRAKANHTGAFVWADSTDADFTTTATNQFLIRASGGVGIGKNNPATALDVNGTVAATAFSGGGASVTLLNAANVASGTLADARLSANVALLAGSQTFNGAKTFTGGTSFNTGAGTIAIQNDSGLTAGLNLTGGSNPGVLRVRNSVEVWPNTGATTAGRLDVRATNGVAGITLDGASGNITCVSLTQTSDRNVKEHFRPVDPAEILTRVAALPITRWNFKQDRGPDHLGPMAQDFYAAFEVGLDDKSICTVDADGVALAAIQGLNEKLEARSQQSEASTRELAEKLSQKETEITELKTRLERIEQLLLNQNAKPN